MEVKIGIEDIRKILDEKFPFYDSSNSSWELADEKSSNNNKVLFGNAYSHWYKVTLNGKTYYSLRNGRRNGVYFFLSREDALEYNNCTKEDILLDCIKSNNL